MALAILLVMCWPTAGAEQPLVLIDGRAIELEAAPLVRNDELLVWLRDLDRMGLGTTRWKAAARVGALITPRLTIEFGVDSLEATVITRSPSGAAVAKAEELAHAPLLSAGKLMVPLTFVCHELGATVEVRTQPVVSLTLPAALASEDHPDPTAKASIAGTVLFGDRPLAGIVLRLVRDSDSTFVPDRRAVTGADGRYRFPGVSRGRYRVYAYVGDNPDYFNRETSPLRVADSDVTAAPIPMGYVIKPVKPLPGSRVPFTERLTFKWTACPGAARYELSAVDPATREEVVFRISSKSEADVLGTAFTLGRVYHWRVLALTDRGDFLGATPGAGAAPWSFTVLAAGDTPVR